MKNLGNNRRQNDLIQNDLIQNDRIQNDRILMETREELRHWLEENHGAKNSVWLVTWKKKSGKARLSYDEIVDECLCFGWIDSLPKKLDEDRSMLRISPRNPSSNWSGINKKRVLRLREEGRMTEAGEQIVRVAKSNGAWDFLNDVEQLIVPDDLDKALSEIESARFYFDRFPPSSRRGILEWIKTAKTEETRMRRIKATAEKAGKNIKANFPKGRNRGPKYP